MLKWLGKRHRDQRRFQQLQTATLCATVINWSMRRPRKPVSPFDFMPGMSQSQRSHDEQIAARSSEQTDIKQRRLVSNAIAQLFSRDAAQLDRGQV